jgi:hypothetical protein
MESQAFYYVHLDKSDEISQVVICDQTSTVVRRVPVLDCSMNAIGRRVAPFIQIKAKKPSVLPLSSNDPSDVETTESILKELGTTTRVGEVADVYYVEIIYGPSGEDPQGVVLRNAMGGMIRRFTRGQSSLDLSFEQEMINMIRNVSAFPLLLPSRPRNVMDVAIIETLAEIL